MTNKENSSNSSNYRGWSVACRCNYSLLNELIETLKLKKAVSFGPAPNS